MIMVTVVFCKQQQQQSTRISDDSSQHAHKMHKHFTVIKESKSDERHHMLQEHQSQLVGSGPFHSGCSGYCVQHLLQIPQHVRGHLCCNRLQSETKHTNAKANQDTASKHKVTRSEERRVGQACVRTCRSRWSPTHTTKKPTHTNNPLPPPRQHHPYHNNKP